MENGLIEDKQLSAHSAWDNNYQRYGSSRARLHLNEWPQGWRAQINDPSPWLQIDLLWTHTVTAVATQGYGSKDAKEWVKTYVLLTSRDGKRWYTYRERGRKRVRRLEMKSVLNFKSNFILNLFCNFVNCYTRIVV